MSGGLPPFLVICLVGITLLGGFGLWVLQRWVCRKGAWTRLLAFHRQQRATTAIETPYALLVLILVTLCVWQLGLLAAAYQVVDYAAFSTARSASVIIPQDYTVAVVSRPESKEFYLAHWHPMLYMTQVEAGIPVRIFGGDTVIGPFRDQTFKERLLDFSEFNVAGFLWWRSRSGYPSDWLIGRWKAIYRSTRTDWQADADLERLATLIEERSAKYRKWRDDNPGGYMVLSDWVDAIITPVWETETPDGDEIEINILQAIRAHQQRVRDNTVTAYTGEAPNELLTSDSDDLDQPASADLELADLTREFRDPEKCRDLYQGAVWLCAPISGLHPAPKFDQAFRSLLDEALGDAEKSILGKATSLLREGSTALTREAVQGLGPYEVDDEVIDGVVVEGGVLDGESDTPGLTIFGLPLNFDLADLVVLAVKKVLKEVVERIVDPIRTPLANTVAAMTSTSNPFGRWTRRYMYARANTRVEITPEKNSWSGGDVVTCTVTHRYHLPIFYARRIFSLMGGGYDDETGYWIPLRASARMVTEGFNEKRPPGAPLSPAQDPEDGFGPNLLPGEEFNRPVPEEGR